MTAKLYLKRTSRASPQKISVTSSGHPIYRLTETEFGQPGEVDRRIPLLASLQLIRSIHVAPRSIA